MSTVDEINALLPQTQCQLCEFEGCKPYAAAMAKGEAPINRCLPGGITTLQALGQTLHIDPAPYIDEMLKKQKQPQTVRVQEDACIGCTKCIQACPVDAIVGRSKHMHTVIKNECNGCELCIPPCPVDCIEIIPMPEATMASRLAQAPQFQARFEAREARLQKQKETQQAKKTMANASQSDRQDAIAAMLQRAGRKP